MAAWFERFLITLAIAIIEKVAGKIAREVKEAADLAAQTKDELELGAKNAELYRQAQAREERIKRALDLLNAIPGSVSASPKVSDKDSLGS